jgi:hypothetical protein
MLKLSIKTNKGKQTIQCPQSWEEVSVEQYIRIIKEWDDEDWIKLFSILSGLDVDYVSQSTNGQIESLVYQTIEFALKPFDWKALPMPEEIDLTPIWLKDNPLIPPHTKVPKKIGRLSIGQAIQARRSLEGMSDIREGISIVTAIYLQPLIDKGPFDMLRVTELEYLIGKNRITKIYPLGFFLLRRLQDNGSWLQNVLRLLKRKSTTKGK